MLVAGDAENGNGCPKQRRVGGAEIICAILDLGQQGLGHLEQRQQVIIPPVGSNIKQQGAAGIGGVGGVHLAPGQPPDQETVDGATGQLTPLGAGPRTLDSVEQPFDLGAGKIWVQQQSGFFGDHGFVAAFAQFGTERRGAPVLPDDGFVNRLAGGAIPDQCGFALIGNADGSDIIGRKTGLFQRSADRPDDAVPDFLRIVLHPAIVREILGKLALPHPCNAAVRRKDNRPARCGSLVDGQHISAHIPSVPPGGGRCHRDHRAAR